MVLLSVFVYFVFFFLESKFGTSQLITIWKFLAQNVNGKPNVNTDQ